MRHPIGSLSVSASGGTAELIGRRGERWRSIAERELPLDEAIALLTPEPESDVTEDPHEAAALPSTDADTVRFAAGEAILWRYARHVEAVRVVRDDDRGLVIWIPSGSARLESAPADGRRTREVALEERFSVPWVMREATWTGPGVLRVAPSGMPWSVWFFRRSDGTPDGAYVNLELPHRRVGGEAAGIFSRDLVLDIWIDAEHRGAEDVWLKDADELDAAVHQGRFSEEQAVAVRSLADHATRAFIADAAWPLDEGWDRWTPDAAMDVPLALPDMPSITAARGRSGRTSGEG
ncbi:DUF402 domain-containing protein [Microbacterium sp. NPDC055903]